MSMTTSIIKGYGFYLEEICSTEIVVRFLKNHLDSLKKITKDRPEIGEFFENASEVDLKMLIDHIDAESTDKESNIADVCEALYDESPYDNGYVYGLEVLEPYIPAIVTIELKTEFAYEPGQEGCQGEGGACLRYDGQPWEFTKAEILIAKDILDESLTRYMDELGISGEPDVVFVEYFG